MFALDVETNKVALLVSFGKAAQHDTGMETTTVESALTKLAELDDVAGIEGWFDANLL